MAFPDSSSGGVGARQLHNTAPVTSLGIITVLVGGESASSCSPLPTSTSDGHGQQAEGSLSGSAGPNWTPGNRATAANRPPSSGGFNVNRLLTMTEKKNGGKSHNHHYFAGKHAQGYFPPFSHDVLLNATISKMQHSTGGTAVCCLSSFSNSL